MENELEQRIERIVGKVYPLSGNGVKLDLIKMLIAERETQAFNAGIEAALGALPEHHSTFNNYTKKESQVWHTALDQARSNIERLKK